MFRAAYELDNGDLSTPLSSRHMEFNVVKIWRKNKMIKAIKINLP